MTLAAVDWTSVTAEQYCESVRDGTHDSPKFVDQGYPLITSKNIKQGRIDKRSVSFVGTDDYEEINKRSKVNQWDILISMIGTVGEVCLIEDEEPSFAIKNVGLFKCKNELDGRWLYYWLRSPKAVSHIRERLRGTSQQYISLGELRNLPVMQPKDALTKAQLIDIIRPYDELIETNRRRIALLEEAARLIYRQLLADSNVCEVGGRLSQGWERTALQSICDQIKRSADPTEVVSDTPYLSMEHMTPRSISLGVWETAGKVNSSKLLFQHNDILFGRIRPYFHKVGIAQTDGITSTDMIVVRAKNENLLPLVALTMSSDEFIAYAVLASNGTKMPRTDWKVLKDWEVIIPPAIELANFAAKILPIFRLLEVLSAQNKFLVLTREIILPKIMSGEICT